MSAEAPAAPDLEAASAEEVLGYVVGEFHPRLALACSFQKEESVLLDMALRIEPTVRVSAIDTGVLFPETYAVWEAWERRYGIAIEAHRALAPGGTRWTAEHCCGPAKVEALERALDGLDAWITGVRREQGPTRAEAPKLAWDTRRGVWKASPLADWSEQRVWAYIAEHDLPYHPLHDRGYASIGCAPCTLPGEGREGRWVGTEKTECGLHEG